MDEKFHVLIADDEALMVRTMSMVLRSSGYRVSTARTGIEAIEKIMSADNPVDMLVTDIQMPGMTGEELVDELHRRLISIPVLAITGFGNKDLVVQLMRKGCQDYIDKPFTSAEFLERVNELAAREQSRQVEGERRSREERDLRAGANHEIDRYRDQLSKLRSEVGSAVEAYSNLIAAESTNGRLSVAWRDRSYTRLGGDFLGVGPIPGGCDVMIADVAGHDMGASYHSVLIKTLFQDNCRKGTDGMSLFRVLNQVLLETNSDRMVTALHVRFMAGEMVLEVVNAGHPAGIMVPAGDSIRSLDAEGDVLGVLDVVSPSVESVRVKAGDRVVLYTDGLQAVRRVDGPTGRASRLSAAGIRRLVNEHRGKGLDTMVHDMWEEAMAFGRYRLEDDAMLAALEIPES